jgi:capsular polysaccharide biosynthesis protein/Mrp family chromosome partitioning ATPase
MPQVINGTEDRAIRPPLGETAERLQEWTLPTDSDVAEPWNRTSPRPRRGLVRVVRNQRWWIVALVVVAVTLATLYTYSRTPTYRSSADVLVQPRVFAAGTVPQAPDMGSEKAAAGSATVLTIAARTLGVSVSTLSGGLSISVPLNTRVLRIAYSAGTARTAKDRAQAVADAYVAYWLTLQPDLSGIGGTTTRSRIVPTEVITPAALPTSPASPNHVTDLTIATIIALLVALGTAYLRDRLDDRLRGVDDAEWAVGTPVVAALPRRRCAHPSELPALSTAPSALSAAYRDLAALVLDAAAYRTARSILITGPTGSAHSMIASNLAASLAGSGQRVVLFFAENAPQPGGVSIDHVRAAAAGLPELQVLEREARSGEFDAAELRQLVRRLRSAADLVVVTGPAALVGSNARALVDAADLLVISSVVHRTTRAQLRATLRRLRPARSKLVGVVLQYPRGARRVHHRATVRGRFPRPRTEPKPSLRPPAPGRPTIDLLAVGIGARPPRSARPMRRDTTTQPPGRPNRPSSTEK